jgi:hypothetical protein
MPFCEDTDYLVRLTERNYRVMLCAVDTLIYRRHNTNATCDVAGARDGLMQLIKRRRARNANQAKPVH